MIEVDDVRDTVVLVGSCVTGTWLLDLIREASAIADPPVERLDAAGGLDLSDLGNAGGTPRILIAAEPGSDIVAVLQAGRARVIAVVDDALDSVRYMQETKGFDFLHAMRDQTRCASAHFLLSDHAGVLLIERRRPQGARDLIGAVLAHLRCNLNPDGREALLERFAGPADAGWSLEAALRARVAGYRDLDTVDALASPQQATLVRQALAPLLQNALDPVVGKIVWSRAVFLSGDRHDAVAPEVADLTGGPRIIFYGPFFCIPSGLWAVRLLVAFSREACGTPFTVTLLCQGRALARVALRPTEPGAFACAFTVRHAEPERWLEIHFANDEGAIEGHVALGQMDFTRLAP